MKKPRISTLVIIGQFVLLLVTAMFLCVTLLHNWFLKQRAKEFAAEAGFSEAKDNFTHGNRWLYQIKLYKFDADDSGNVPTDGTIEPSGKMDGQFQMYYFLVDQNWPKVHQEIQQAYVDGYNQHMHQYIDHPEWFDKNGFRISSVLKSQTNTNSPSSDK